MNLKKHTSIWLIALLPGMFACDDDSNDFPPVENETEVITDVMLTFSNQNDTSDVVSVIAKDPDGQGIKGLEVLDSINLKSGATYDLSMVIKNTIDTLNPVDIGFDIKKEAADHQFFFAFTQDAFSDPTGVGNIEDREGKINYLDFDANKNPLGLSTRWTTGAALSGGSFTVVLKHQPDGIKSKTSTSNDGDTDFKVEFVLNIE